MMGWPMAIFLPVLGLFAVIKIYVKSTTGWCKSETCLTEKTIIVTGANTGIGYETALDFAKRGARVVLACRDQRKGEEAREKIIVETGNGNIDVRLIDMASFDSVREFAKDFNRTEDHLDILVNNAGAFGLGDKKSKDGHLLLMQVNYFSPFLLTNLLISVLKKSKPSRVVNVSSLTARYVRDFDLNQINQSVSDSKDYSNSKLCNILFTKELARRLEGTGVTVYSLHPGLVKTNIQNNLKGVIVKMLYAVLNLFSKTCEEGAQTTIYCCVDKEVEKYNGEHFADCERVESYATATDAELAKKLWKATEEIVQLKRDEIYF